jgi:hypothetical protein
MTSLPINHHPSTINFLRATSHQPLPINHQPSTINWLPTTNYELFVSRYNFHI